MRTISKKLREIQEGLSYDERFSLSITLVVLGDLGMEKFYQRDRTTVDKLVKAGIIKPVPQYRHDDKGWYEPATAEIGSLLVCGSINKEDGYLVLPE